MAATAWYPVTQIRLGVNPQEPEHVCLAIATGLDPMGFSEPLIEVGEDELPTHVVLTRNQTLDLLLALGQAPGIDVDQPAQEE
jgi:hypothetical protein